MKRPTVGSRFSPRRFAAAFLAAIALFGAASPAVAQDAPATLPAALESARHDQAYLRITTATGTVEGRVLDLSDNVVELAGGSVSLADVTRVEKGEKRGGGATLGAAIGAGIMALLGVFAVAQCEYGDCAAYLPVGALLGASIGAVPGGLIGAAVSPSHRAWRTIWSR